MEPAKLKFNECINEINKLKIQEVIEGSISEKQILFFIEYLIQNPNIKNILEIGFNLGSSAAAFLSARTDTIVISIDIGIHSYVKDAKKVINTCFPNRHTLLIGDSKILMRKIELIYPNFKPDLIFIDGDHIEPTPIIDLRNALYLANKDTSIILDDCSIVNGYAGVIQAYLELIKYKEIDVSSSKIYVDGVTGWILMKKPKTKTEEMKEVIILQ
jgi:predicted O-methyltransferase YrrM